MENLYYLKELSKHEQRCAKCGTDEEKYVRCEWCGAVSEAVSECMNLLSGDINQGHGNNLSVAAVNGNKDGRGLPDSLVITAKDTNKSGLYKMENT